MVLFTYTALRICKLRSMPWEWIDDMVEDAQLAEFWGNARADAWRYWFVDPDGNWVVFNMMTVETGSGRPLRIIEVSDRNDQGEEIMPDLPECSIGIPDRALD